jgi:predicted dehydrogenase
MEKIKLGMLGGGIGAFIGDAHRRASRICNAYTLVGGAFSSDFDKTKQFALAEGLDLTRCYANVDEMVIAENLLPESERIQVVSIVTPNYLHFYQAKTLLENGFHVICDKPLTMTSEEAEVLQKLTLETQKVFCVTHTYTGYPMVRQMRELIAAGEVGNIYRIDVQYYQGWVSPVVNGCQTGLNIWRLNPKVAGISSCMGDIGVHAFNLLEYTTGLKVSKVLADLSTVSDTIELDLDGTVLLRFDNNVRAVLRASQVANGEENNIRIAVYGSKSSLKWEQEDPNRLFQMADNCPEKIYRPGNGYNTSFAEDSHTMPFGHPEGIYEALANIYQGVALAINGQKTRDDMFPTINEGVRGMKFIECAVKSNSVGSQWVHLQ